MKASVFIPCSVDQFGAQTGFNLIELLTRVGVEVDYPLEQTCCGKIAYYEGDKDTAKRLGEMFMNNFSAADYIVGCSSSCTSYMKRYFGKLYYNSAYHNTYSNYVNRIFDVTEFLVHVVKKLELGVKFPHTVAFVDDGSSFNDCGLYLEPRLLLQKVEGLKLVKLNSENVSCGFGESFASIFESVSTHLAKIKIQEAIDKGAEYITSTDMGCLLHLQSYINKAKLNIKCKHIVDILTSNE